jgi:hypothetical protein
MSTRHGAPGGLGRGLSALIRTNPRPEEAERSVAVLDPAAGSDPSGGVILDSSVTPEGGRRTEPPAAPPARGRTHGADRGRRRAHPDSPSSTLRRSGPTRASRGRFSTRTPSGS